MTMTLTDSRSTRMASESDERKRRRQEASSRRKTERQRAIELLAGLREPPPSELVKSYQGRAQRERERAQKQRDLAMVAVSRGKKREHLAEAKRADDRARSYDFDAQKARTNQVESWRAALTDIEIATQAERRGEVLKLATTEVSDFVRGKHGELVKDDKGLPVLRVEKAKARRRTSGLEHVMSKGRITRQQYEAGIWYGELCANADLAGISGREETGIPAPPLHKAPVGPADHRLLAVLLLRHAESGVRRVYPGAPGEAMIELLRAVCWDGKTPRQVAGDERAGIRYEERLGFGLAALHVAKQTKLYIGHLTGARELSHENALMGDERQARRPATP